MAKKSKTVFVCQECGYESPKWMGQCVCGAWNTMVEEKVVDVADSRSRVSTGSNKARSASKLKDVKSGQFGRIDTGINELNRVLGGGLVEGSLTLISGEPGIGKSTLILQAAANIAKNLGTVLYVSGEESEEQIKIRADRVCKDLDGNLLVVSETNLDNIIDMCEEIKPKFLIIDSIQTMYSSEIDSAPGSVSQVRVCGNILMKLGKSYGIPTFIVAHVTKSGELAGPKIVEHLVDCVLNFTGERDQELRILRAYKNRFGTTSEIGAFQMVEEGLIEVDNLSGNLLENDKPIEGSITTAIYEGSRSVLFDIQALVASAGAGFPRRTAIGFDNQRLSMILAVLEKRAYLNLSDKDVYTNVVGGLRPDSTSVDLALALAIFSSAKGYVPKERVIAIGEIGLTGEIRSVSNADKIAAEAMRLGYTKIILPAKSASKVKANSAEVVGVKNIYEAIKALED
ncbi:MAG: DNA repair protein RadA [Clostridia bacterium]|nr:DNA repair protein RadA [Clostridia bacterium]